MIYDYKCEHCQHEEEKVNVPSEKRDNQKCEQCGEPATRIFSVGHLFVDVNIGKYDQVLGQVIESSHHRRQVMKEKGFADIVKVGTATKQIAQHNEKVRQHRRTEGAKKLRQAAERVVAKAGL